MLSLGYQCDQNYEIGGDEAPFQIFFLIRCHFKFSTKGLGFLDPLTLLILLHIATITYCTRSEASVLGDERLKGVNRMGRGNGKRAVEEMAEPFVASLLFLSTMSFWFSSVFGGRSPLTSRRQSRPRIS